MYMVETENFELTGNQLCLDFVNTLDDRLGNPPLEHLNSYADLVSWSEQKHLVTEIEIQHLLELAKKHPGDASTIFQRAIVLREALFRIFVAVADHTKPAEADFTLLNDALSSAMCHSCVVPKAKRFVWDWADKEKALDGMLWQVARSAANLLTSKHLDDVRVCAAEDCEWLFMDTSKNHSRRWCDMKSCGNREKARRHYERKK
jgi:predicted RNA-binding Zn ribbon-like protein